MRTTLNIDDDVLAAARERARREKRSVGDVLSDLARSALSGRSSDSANVLHGFPVLPRRGVIVTNELIDRLRDEEGV